MTKLFGSNTIKASYEVLNNGLGSIEMKSKNIVWIVVTLFLVSSFMGCSGKKSNSSVSAYAEDNFQRATTGAEITQANNAQTNYYGEMEYEALVMEMQKVASDFQAGKIKMEEYLQRLEELQKKLTVAVGTETTSTDSTGNISGSTVSGNTQSNTNRVVEKKYRGVFINIQNTDDNGRSTGLKILFDESNILEGSWANFDDSHWYDGPVPFAWTVGNELMVQMESDLPYTKLGTFTDNNTFVYEYTRLGIRLTESRTYKRQ